MGKYEVIRPWLGVKLGDVVEMEKVHPSLEANLRLMRGAVAGELNPATPGATNEAQDRKAIIAARLTDLGIEFKGTLGAAKLTELLPDGELEKLFPAE